MFILNFSFKIIIFYTITSCSSFSPPKLIFEPRAVNSLSCERKRETETNRDNRLTDRRIEIDRLRVIRERVREGKRERERERERERVRDHVVCISIVLASI